MKPIEIACRHCSAQMGERCNWGEPFDVPDLRDEFHQERILDSADAGDQEISATVIDAAVEKLGIV